MVNTLYVDMLVNLIKQGLLAVTDIKIPDYATAVQAKLTA